MAWLRSALFALFFYSGSVVAVLLALPAALIGRGPLLSVTFDWARWHRFCARHLLGIRTRIEGAPPQGPALVASKHQSMFETVEMLLLLDEPAVVLKRQLADIPGWGRVAQSYGVIPVDREGGATALRRMLKAARQAVASGRPILIFPEGTRVHPGEQPALQPGFAGLYSALKLPVVPIALDSGTLWPRRSFVKRPGVITIRFGEPIPPGLPRAEIEARVREAINSLEHTPGS
jgi:1-acyl-sn-glycerol-3-phosphate acyltransferase